MYVDSICATQMVKLGTGLFTCEKHMKVRFFCLKELIDEGKIKMI
jgi:hypothetical protein